MDSTILNLAIALTLRDALTGQLQNAIHQIGQMSDVTDEVKKKLQELGNITFAGGILAGAGIAGLKATMNTIDECVERYSVLEDAQVVLENKAFGKKLIEEGEKDKIVNFSEAVKELNSNMSFRPPQVTDSLLPIVNRSFDEDLFHDLHGSNIEQLSNKAKALAMDIGANTTFDAAEITNSMTALVKGGASIESVLDGMAEANANFAQVNRVSAEATADGTVQMASGFGLAGDEIMEAMEYVNQFADATISDSLDIQRAIGNVAGAASSIWGSRNNIDVAKDTIELTAFTTNIVGDEASAATYSREFLNRANMSADRMSDKHIAAMQKAGWMDSDGHSIFIDYKTGMLKDIHELEKILEEGKNELSDHEFSNILNTIFIERGGKVANALAEKGEFDLSDVDASAANAMAIADQVKREMNLLSNIKDSYEESKNNLMITLGEPFAEPQKAIYTGLKDIMGDLTDFFTLHPEVTKFIAALAGGVSTIATVAGAVTMLVGAGGALKLIWGIAEPSIIASMAPIAGVMLPIIAIVTALAGIGVLAYRNWDKVGPHFAQIGNKIGAGLNFAAEKGKQFLEWIKPFAEEYGPMIEEFLVSGLIVALDFLSFQIDVLGKSLSFIGLTISLMVEEGKLAFELLVAIIDGDTGKIHEIIVQMGERSRKYISDVFGLLPEKALTWGKNLIDSFANGIKSGLDSIPNVLNNAASIVKSWIGVESPTKEGPLRHNHLWGGNLITSLSTGMVNKMDELRFAAEEAASLMNLDGSWAFDTQIKQRFIAEKVLEIQNPKSRVEEIQKEDANKNNNIGSLTIQIYAQPEQDEEMIANIVLTKIKAIFDTERSTNPNPATTFSQRGVYSY